MSIWHTHDPATYKVGDPIYLQVPDGWSQYTAHRYIVSRITPAGQIVADRDGDTIRINAKGNIIGEGLGRSSRNVCTKEHARELLAGKRLRSAWYSVRNAAENVQQAARQSDATKLDEALTALADRVADLRAATPTDQVKDDGKGGEA